MEHLTAKEEELMQYFWQKDALFVRELLDMYPEPKPHFNTLSTMVRTLETKGFLSHKSFGNSYQYLVLIKEEEFKKRKLKQLVGRYFENSYMSAVSALLKDEEISLDELKELIDRIEQQK